MGLPPIKGFLETSFIDWPGQVAAVVFLPGCNFRCPYCHNHGLVLHPEEYQSWSLEGILLHLDKYRSWVDGVCVSGGEPTGHAGLPELLRQLRAAGWATKLDTNGSRPEVLRLLLDEGLLDAVALDLKAPLEAIPYRRNSGWNGDPQRVAESLELALAAGLSLQVRTTVHPNLLGLAELERLAADLGERVRWQRGAGGEGVRFTVQRCRVEEVLDNSLPGQPGLDVEAFAAWQEQAMTAYRLGNQETGKRTPDF
ncbi:MAG: anaerobic ribonucleoside-triphosphate reductase activating protein [Deferrisomatales bacterium]|nr:anaerobic ribonucleoside-triphosphate reductase activating protein [Deferrisomatales bacterium]